mmetsp:Transcript_77946/g.208312  ORF Transcript_77946/g.208312 Transcript_77946/m.208312 type:complete len:213 (-) Transcript_77946:1540-2178(-)
MVAQRGPVDAQVQPTTPQHHNHCSLLQPTLHNHTARFIRNKDSAPEGTGARCTCLKLFVDNDPLHLQTKKPARSPLPQYQLTTSSPSPPKATQALFHARPSPTSIPLAFVQKPRLEPVERHVPIGLQQVRKHHIQWPTSQLSQQELSKSGPVAVRDDGTQLLHRDFARVVEVALPKLFPQLVGELGIGDGKHATQELGVLHGAIEIHVELVH